MSTCEQLTIEVREYYTGEAEAVTFMTSQYYLPEAMENAYHILERYGTRTVMRESRDIGDGFKQMVVFFDTGDVS